MRDYIEKVINKNYSAYENRNLLREYLQKFILFIIYRKKIFREIVFTGGTCIRLLYGMNRFSEDLNYSLSYSTKNFDFLKMIKLISAELDLSGYDLEIKSKVTGNVNSSFLKFKNLLYETGISPNKEELLSVKLEVDTNPPEGGAEEQLFLNFENIFYVRSYDLSSLFAGKLHALIARCYNKGRDYYDLLWYLTKYKNIEPNYIMLSNALKQTGEVDVFINKDNWKSVLLEKLRDKDYKTIRNDVVNFLANKEEAELISFDTFKVLLEGKSSNQDIFL
jgi:predicted nucleotidyltransferase component of viral defense system